MANHASTRIECSAEMDGRLAAGQVLLFRLWGPIWGGLGIGKERFYSPCVRYNKEQAPLRSGAALNIGLRLLDRAVTSELLHVAQATAGARAVCAQIVRPDDQAGSIAANPQRAPSR